MAEWEYGGAYLRHDMRGPIALPNASMVEVCDLTAGLPAFMLEADTLFIDPPCSTGNLRSFHTKAGLPLNYSFAAFEASLFGCIDQIAPKHLFLELFASNRDAFLARTRHRYPSVRIYDSHYYRKQANRCWIVHASATPCDLPLAGLDEADAIAWVCRHHEYDTIGDMCMGRGLVGRHAYLAGRRFVGTELNPRRLAVLVDFIRTTESTRAAA
jgi:hypothetical protein